METELIKALKEVRLLDYFNKLAPSHQREYVAYILEAKKTETKTKRILKTLELLKEKSNLNDC